MRNNSIKIRNPFVLPVSTEGTYYLYGTIGESCCVEEAGVGAYSSENLENWNGPYKVVNDDDKFLGEHNFCAPEVHFYNGKYYMLVNLKVDQVCKGIQVLISDSPKGPFALHSDGVITPSDWECLDGTLYVDEEGDPWVIFCHEWLQVSDGKMYAIKLSKELRTAVSEPYLLFKASDAAWSQAFGDDTKCYIIHGPFIYKTESGQLLMLWSSGGSEGYAVGTAYSESGDILGPWKQDKEHLLCRHGCHGMIFKTFEGNLMLAIHSPNNTPYERPVFIDVAEYNGRLVLK